jgi:Ca-activated chloride channel family protein
MLVGYRARTILTLLVSVPFLVAALAAGAQDTPTSDSILQIDVDLVLVNATVRDERNRFMIDLRREHFQVFEDRVQQEIEFFSSEQLPVSVGVVFDLSGSMGPRLRVARDAVARFLETLTPSDEYLLVEFNSRSELTQGFTTDVSRLQNRLVFAEAEGRTALYDATYNGLQAVLRDGINPRKALLLITDGMDNASRYTFSDLREALRESDVQIYSIGILDSSFQSGRGLLREMAEETGGLSFFPGSVYELGDIMTRVSTALKNQYLLGYRSTNQTADGAWRDIQVRIEPPRGSPDLFVLPRRGYYAPVR